MNDLLKEAIADAKAVRETAMANAKAALEEAFTPRLQSMLHAKLAEEMDDEMEMEEDMELDLGDEMEAPMEPEMELDMEPEMELDMEPEMDMEEDMDMEADMNLDLDEILRELDAADSDEIGASDNKLDVDAGDSSEIGEGKYDDEMDEEIDLDEVIASLREEEDDMDETKEEMDEAKDEEMEEGKYEKEMEEAYNVIRYLKSQLQEVNLLNAKLLFSNKLFKNHELNESQKMKVIENFDRAHNMREVKLVYSTLAEGFGKTKSKVRIKESYASKPTKSTKPAARVITEGNELATRWKKLAGLSK